MAQTIIDFITTGIFILAVIFIIVGGLTILLAGAVPSNLELGKKIITNAIIGVIIALLAWTVINMIFNTLVSTDKNKFPAPWNDIECKIEEEEENKKNLYCHIIQNEEDKAKMVEYYFSEIFCQTGCDSEHCAGKPPLKNCFKWCCLDKDKSGQDFACEGTEKKPCQQAFSVSSSSGCSDISTCVDISNYTPTHGCESNNGKCLVSQTAAQRIQTFISKFNSLSGGKCTLRISSAIQGSTGPSVSSCHKLGNSNSGTCVDFNLLPNHEACYEAFYQAAKDSSAVVSFLDEYVDVCKPSNATGGNIHVNF